MQSRLNAGSDYSFQQHKTWASSISAGSNATPTTDLRFQTLWVSNSHLIKIVPWISYPSGSLRFQFKDGVTGTAKIYISLSDHDGNSPENSFLNVSANSLARDHSSIEVVEISVGSADTDTTASDVRIASLTTQNTEDLTIDDSSESSTSGGGGAPGFALFALAMMGLRRRRH